jgi:hypothetical protein
MSKKKTNTKASKPQNGKGDSPRNIFSKDYKKNYDKINWKKKKS